jgi:hypothetical protein
MPAGEVMLPQEKVIVAVRTPMMNKTLKLVFGWMDLVGTIF